MSEKEVFDYVDKYMLDDKEYQSLVKKIPPGFCPADSFYFSKSATILSISNPSA